jgi:hypothetical protein
MRCRYDDATREGMVEYSGTTGHWDVARAVESLPPSFVNDHR